MYVHGKEALHLLCAIESLDSNKGRGGTPVIETDVK